MVDSPVVTIDGPSGVGKGTLCLFLAKKTGWHLLDSGAIYRVLALNALNTKVSLDDVNQIATLVHGLSVDFQNAHNSEKLEIYLNNHVVTDQIRTEECGNAASKIAKYPMIRKALLERQRMFKRPPGLIADGRDMGTVVFPHAQAKVFLTASLEERVNRRYKQLKEQGFSVNLARLSEEIAERDERDLQRIESPLKPAEDAEVIDTTILGIEQVKKQVWNMLTQRIPELGKSKTTN